MVFASDSFFSGVCDFRRGYISRTTMRLPKGLYLHFYLYRDWAFYWHTAKDWPMNYNVPDKYSIRFMWFHIVITELPF